MVPEDKEYVLQVLFKLSDLEMTLSSFYAACANAFPDDREFWAVLSGQEKTHAEYLAKLSALVDKDPGDFHLKLPFKTSDITATKIKIEGYIRDARAGKLDEPAAMLLSKEIENSVFESDYREFLITENQQFRIIIDAIVTDTFVHKVRIEDKIAQKQMRSA